MIEPTETEAKETLDDFVEAMRDIAAEAASDPRALKDAPHRRPVRRLDEVKAAKRAIVKYGFDEHPGYEAGAGRGRAARGSEGRVTAAKQEIGARVDALSQALDGNEFVAAVERMAEGMSSDERLALQEVLLERAADEDDLQQAVRRRFAERGWTRRTLARLEGLWRDDRADAIAARDPGRA